MARKAQPWLRLYVEMFHDRKIKRLKPAQRWVWVAILGAARESPEPGMLYVAPGEPMSKDELADYATVSKRDVLDTLAAAERLSMVTIEGDVIVVTNWPKRQFESDDVTQRTRAHRERSKEHVGNVPKNVRGNAPETETETETETEGASHPSRERSETPDRFDEFWSVYDHKIGRKKAETAYRTALKKPDVTEDLLIAAAAEYVGWVKSEGKHPAFTKHPTTWLHGEHWNDERVARQQPLTNTQRHMALVEELRAEQQANVRQVGDGR